MPGSLTYRRNANLLLSGRLDAYLNNPFGDGFVQQGYLALHYKKWQV